MFSSCWESIDVGILTDELLSANLSSLTCRPEFLWQLWRQRGGGTGADAAPTTENSLTSADLLRIRSANKPRSIDFTDVPKINCPSRNEHQLGIYKWRSLIYRVQLHSDNLSGSLAFVSASLTR